MFHLFVSLVVVVGFVVKRLKTWRDEDILSNFAIHEMDSCFSFDFRKSMSFNPYTDDMLHHRNS
jgi:hypothetical protein